MPFGRPFSPYRFAIFLAILILDAIIGAFLSMTFLQPDEQVLLKGLSTLTVRNGPGLKMYPPLVTRATKRKGTTLDERQYVVVTNTLTGARRVERGPQLFFAGPHDQFHHHVQSAYQLQNHQAKAANEKLQASIEGEAEGTRLAQSAKVFLALLNESLPKDSGADARLDLLRFFSEQRTLTTQTQHLSQGTATLFLTPQDVNLKLQVPGAQL